MTARWSGVLPDGGGNALAEEDLEVEASAGLLTTTRQVVSRSDVSDGCS
jgi:hypothetical protein